MHKPAITTAYIIHGYGATPDDHWFGWLEQELIQQGVKARRIALPDSTMPDFALWQQTLAQSIGQLSGDTLAQTLFVAHSLGVITTLHYVCSLNAHKLGGLLLVSGRGERLSAATDDGGFDLNRYMDSAVVKDDELRRSAGKIISVISGNDYIVEPEASYKLACRLRSDVYSVPEGGHFMGDDGFTTLPVAMTAIQNILSWVDFATGSTHPVGSKKPNPWGLYDIYSNAWEWVQDDYRLDYASIALFRFKGYKKPSKTL